MKLLVVENHDGEGVFPTFIKGSILSPLRQDNEYPVYPNWYGTDIDGYSTYLPDIYVTDSKLNCDYNPTELIVKKGQTVKLVKVVYSWLYVVDENGNEGWLPAYKAISANR